MSWEAKHNKIRDKHLTPFNCGDPLGSSGLAAIGTTIHFLFIMNHSFIDNPQIEEVMYRGDESLDQFLDEQGDIMGMNIECNEFDTDMTV